MDNKDKSSIYLLKKSTCCHNSNFDCCGNKSNNYIMVAFLWFSVLCHCCTNRENHQANVNNLPNSKIHTFTSFFLPNTDDNKHNTSQMPVAVRNLNSNPKQRQISQTINEVNAQLIARSAMMSNAIPKIFFHIFLTSLPSDFLLELLPPR